MGITAWGVQFICDICGVTGNSPAAPVGSFLWADQPRPDGWTALGPDLAITARDVYGSGVEHLCGACSQLSIGELASRMHAKIRDAIGKG